MKPNEFPLDATWRDLAHQAAVAQRQAEEAETAVRQHGYAGGRKEALEDAERRLDSADEAIKDREELISHSDWGTF